MKFFSCIALFFSLLFTAATTSNAYVILPEGCRGKDLDHCIEKHQLDYIFIYGEITIEEYKTFKKIDENWDKTKEFPPVYVESIGGSVDAAMEVGRVLRKRRATIYTGNPISRLDRAECYSSCVFVAAGAERRILSGIGLHDGVYTISLGRKGEKTEKSDEFIDNEIRDYLREMKIDDEVFNLIKATPNESIHLIYFVEDFPQDDQLIHKLGFRMAPSIKEKANVFERYVRDESDYGYLKIKNAAYYGSVAAVRELIKINESIADGKEPDFIRAQYWSEFGVKLGDPIIMHNYAVVLDNGFYGKKDEQRAVELYSQAAQMGHASSQNNLGWHFYKGEGVKQNVPLAIFWLSQAATRGDFFAYGSLCEMHGAGDVFPKDDVEAYKWCELALSNLEKGAAKTASETVMASLKARMTDTDIEKAKILVSEWKPMFSEIQMRNKEDW